MFSNEIRSGYARTSWGARWAGNRAAKEERGKTPSAEVEVYTMQTIEGRPVGPLSPMRHMWVVVDGDEKRRTARIRAERDQALLGLSDVQTAEKEMGYNLHGQVTIRPVERGEQWREFRRKLLGF